MDISTSAVQGNTSISFNKEFVPEKSAEEMGSEAADGSEVKQTEEQNSSQNGFTPPTHQGSSSPPLPPLYPIVENGVADPSVPHVAQKPFSSLPVPQQYPPSFTATATATFTPNFDMQQQPNMQQAPMQTMIPQHIMQGMQPQQALPVMMQQPAMMQQMGQIRPQQLTQQPMSFHHQQQLHQQQLQQQQLHMHRLQYQRHPAARFIAGPQHQQLAQPGLVAPSGVIPQQMTGGVMRLIPVATGPLVNGVERLPGNIGLPPYRPPGYPTAGVYPAVIAPHNGAASKPIQRLFTENYDQEQMTTRVNKDLSHGFTSERKTGSDSLLGSSEETRLSAAGSESHDGDTVSSSRMDCTSESLGDSDSFLMASNHSLADSSTTPSERKGNKGSGSNAGSAIKKQKPAGSSVVYERMLALGDEPGREPFLQQLFSHMKQQCTPICSLPVICKSTIDLFTLYHVVKERGGMQEVTRLKKWRDVSALVGQGPSSSAGFAVKRNYCKYLFSFECKVDRGGVDPGPILAAMEAAIKRDSRKPSNKKYLDIGDDIAETESEMNESMESLVTPFNFSNSFGLPSTNSMMNCNNSNVSLLRDGGYGHPGFQPGAGATASYHPGLNSGGIVTDQRVYNGFSNNSVPTSAQQSYEARATPAGRTAGQDASAAAASAAGGGAVKAEEDEFSRSDSRQSLDPTAWLQANQNSSRRLDFNATESASAGSLNMTRRNTTFPSGTVEATKPTVVKKRRLHSRHLGEVDMNRILKALRSGLLAECTWALDVLCVTSREDSSHSQLSLAQYPQLLSLLLEHIDRCLRYLLYRKDVLHECSEAKEAAIPSRFDDLPPLKLLNPAALKDDEREVMRNCRQKNYTYKTRGGKDVKIEEGCDVVMEKKLRSSEEDVIMTDCIGKSHFVNHMCDVSQADFCRQQFFGAYFSGIKTESNFTEDLVSTNIDIKQELLSHEEKDEKIVLVNGAVNGLENGGDSVLKHDINMDCDSVLNSTQNHEKSNEKSVPSGVNVNENKSFFSLLLDDDLPMERYIFSANQIDALRSDCPDLSDDWLLRPNDSSQQTLAACDDMDVEVRNRLVTLVCILRNASFITANCPILSHNISLLQLMVRLMRLSPADIKCDCERASGSTECDDCWSRCVDTFTIIKEHAFVICVNIAGKLELCEFHENICASIIDSLLHCFMSSSSTSVDALPGCKLSLRRLSLEALAKFSVTDSNVDLILAMRPYSRIMLLLSQLIDELRVGPSTNQIIRELSLGLLSRLVRSDSGIARSVSLYQPAVPILIEFIEAADKVNKLELYSIDASSSSDLNDTSSTLLIRAAETLQHVVDAAQNDPIVLRHEQRLLSLAMSTTLDEKVTAILSLSLATFALLPRTK